MKISEAMRLGAKQHPQGYGLVVQRDLDTKVILCTCALGAAAVGGEIDNTRLGPHTYQPLFELWPELNDALPVKGREDDGVTTTVSDEIIQMNDSAKMTREEIADWLEARGY